MKVLLLSTHLNAGGIVSYMYLLAKGLIAQGHDVYVLTAGGNKEEAFKSLGAHVVRLNIKTKSQFSPKLVLAYRKLYTYVNEHEIDVVHAQTRVTQVLAQKLLERNRVATVTTCHGFFKPKLTRKLFPCWGKKVIAISVPVKDHLLTDLKAQEDDVVLVQNGIQLEQYGPVDNRHKQIVREELNIKSRPTVGIIARLSDVKGQDILIRSMKRVVERVPDAQCLLIGQGKTEKLLRKLVDECHVARFVYFIPVIEDLLKYLAAIDVFVMPSRMEGLGLSVMEAQASGLPVIASNVGGLPSLIEHGKTGRLVETEDVEELAEAIIELLIDEEKRGALGMAARQKALDQYSVDIMVEKTVQVYKNAVNG